MNEALSVLHPDCGKKTPIAEWARIQQCGFCRVPWFAVPVQIRGSQGMWKFEDRIGFTPVELTVERTVETTRSPGDYRTAPSTASNVSLFIRPAAAIDSAGLITLISSGLATVAIVAAVTWQPHLAGFAVLALPPMLALAYSHARRAFNRPWLRLDTNRLSAAYGLWPRHTTELPLSEVQEARTRVPLLGGFRVDVQTVSDETHEVMQTRSLAAAKWVAERIQKRATAWGGRPTR